MFRAFHAFSAGKMSYMKTCKRPMQTLISSVIDVPISTIRARGEADSRTKRCCEASKSPQCIVAPAGGCTCMQTGKVSRICLGTNKHNL